MGRLGKTIALFGCACLTGCLTIEPWQKPIEALIAKLHDQNQAIRAAAASNLGDHAAGSELDAEEALAAVSALRLALRDPFREVRLRAAGGLEGLGPRAAPAVSDLARTATDDPDRRVRVLAWRALAGIGPPALPALKSAIGRKDVRTRVAALGALEQSVDVEGRALVQQTEVVPNPTHTEQVIAVVGAALADSSARVRGLAVHVLGRRFSPWPEAVGPHLTRALRDEDERVAAHAARYLAELERLPTEAPADLHRLLHPRRELGRGLHELFEQGREAPVAASIALVQHGYAPERALGPLLAAAVDPLAPDRLGAIRALRAFNGRAADVTLDLAKLLGPSVDPALRHASIRTIGSIGPAAHPAAAALRRVATSDGDQRLRTAAREALRRLGR